MSSGHSFGTKDLVKNDRGRERTGRNGNPGLRMRLECIIIYMKVR